MPRLTHDATGAVVNVSEEKAKQLGAGWVVDAKPKAEPKKSGKK